MKTINPLEIQDADNIDFNTNDIDESSNELSNKLFNEIPKELEDNHIHTNNEPQKESEANIIVEPNEMALDEPGFFYNLLHILDDIYVYGRTVIENNYFNLSDNVDFNIVYPNIYIGNYSTSTNLELLQGLGITHIITVLPSFNPPFPDKFNYLHIQAYDDETQNLAPFFQKTNQFITNVLTQRGKLLIHCMVGRSRSVSIFIAFLIHLIRGQFNQSFVDTTGINDVSNEIEYNKIIGKIQGIITDGVPPVRCDNIQHVSDSKGSDEEISRIEYLPPAFGNKYCKFMNYKKDIMISEVDKLIKKYNELNNNKDDLYLDILAYVKKYRFIACPNVYFEKQLRNLLL